MLSSVSDLKIICLAKIFKHKIFIFKSKKRRTKMFKRKRSSKKAQRGDELHWLWIVAFFTDIQEIVNFKCVCKKFAQTVTRACVRIDMVLKNEQFSKPYISGRLLRLMSNIQILNLHLMISDGICEDIFCDLCTNCPRLQQIVLSASPFVKRKNRRRIIDLSNLQSCEFLELHGLNGVFTVNVPLSLKGLVIIRNTNLLANTVLSCDEILFMSNFKNLVRLHISHLHKGWIQRIIDGHMRMPRLQCLHYNEYTCSPNLFKELQFLAQGNFTIQKL